MFEFTLPIEEHRALFASRLVAIQIAVQRIELKKPPGERVPEDQTLSAMLDAGGLDAVITPLLPPYILRALPGCAACSQISARWKKLTIKRPACFRSS